MDLTSLSALIIFVGTFFIIVTEKVHRTIIALLGAILMVMLGVLNQQEAIEGVDFNTLGLLVGMMVIVGIARQSGFFQAMALSVSKLCKGKPIPIFILLCSIVGIFSAFLNNVTVVLLMVPVTFVITNNLKISPYPYLIGIIMFSNFGGAATLIGDPPNTIIGSAAGLSFNDFINHIAPVVIVICIICAAVLLWIYRKEFHTTDERREKVMKFNPRDAITDWPLLYKSLAVIFLVVVGFVTYDMTGIEAATMALGGAALLLLLTVDDPEVHLQQIEWITIFFFIGLFVLVAGIEHVGIISSLASNLMEATGGDLKLTAIVMLWGSAILSAIVDNVPFVATMIPFIKDIGSLTGADVTVLWWVLALGADIGGNATLIGASSNLVVRGIAEKEGECIHFFRYMKVAMPLTVLALLISTGYVLIRYF
ncbi:ArsB/NhaD family transporter [Candidatus Nomurabacteria bacterium]|nr:ArsB/NhaD family transporter [Candidatus Nomurabacteria bacterium]